MKVTPVYDLLLVDEGPTYLHDVRHLDDTLRAQVVQLLLDQWAIDHDGSTGIEKIGLNLWDLGFPGDPYSIAFGVFVPADPEAEPPTPLTCLGAGMLYNVDLVSYDRVLSTAELEGDLLVNSPIQAVRDRLYEVGAEGFDVTTQENPAAVHITVVGGFPE